MVFAGDRVALKDSLPCKSQPDLHPAASVNRCGSSWEKTYGGNGAACLAQHRRLNRRSSASGALLEVLIVAGQEYIFSNMIDLHFSEKTIILTHSASNIMLRRFASHPRCTLHRSGLSNLIHIAADTVQRLISMLGDSCRVLGKSVTAKRGLSPLGKPSALAITCRERLNESKVR